MHWCLFLIKQKINYLCNILKQNRIGIISTGSTSKKIKSLGFDCFEISNLTNFNEVLGGRVKTLHPKIYISILHNRNNDNHKNTFNKIKFPKIDYVIVNLYPFSKYTHKKDKDAIEMIDVGGPTLLRAAAKNYESVTTISSPSDYKLLKINIDKNSGNTDLNFRKQMAKKTFELTYKYDQSIHKWLSQKKLKKNIILRYGENPNQKAVIKKNKNVSIVDYQLQGKAISYNNILDIDSGLDFLSEFTEPTSVIVKHNNACGVASSRFIKKSFVKAFSSDKKSAFGGVVLTNKKIDSELAKLIVKNFFEVLVSPGFTKSALQILSKRKNLILINSIKIPKTIKETTKSVRMGSLIQKNNNLKLSIKNFKIVSKNSKLTQKERNDVLFAFKVVKHIKSNAIVLVKNKQTVGIGAGQMNRYDATKLAIMKYKENFSIRNIVCASDAFFPFVDSLKLLMKNNCACIVEPHGSINDKKIIDFVNKNRLKLVFSNLRVFKH
ncbi:bifunctional phosphoribosylaminoimidazolecarboxamide formyltransferase/IMP cyclohydrolase [Pelagibacteraceae bacterium]|nr:bifunctional phosphoribosylaminoimidazolecarboxamide formyltransferase/IMP cyclohydrolase [Pelagibacteraceae bacterium]